MKNKNHIIVDSSGLIYQAFFSYGVLSYDNKPTGVIYGFLKKVLAIAKKFETNHFYFCFDHSVNYRKQIDPVYKAQRVKHRKELSKEDLELFNHKFNQEVELRDFALKSMGFRNLFIQKGYEGDDLMAYICEKLKAKKVIMVSADNDMFQCLNDCDIVSPKKLKKFTKKDFLEKYKVDPSQWPLCKAIGGCSGDNVIGIKGASDPKQPKSKALKYVRKELIAGKIYERITSKQGKDTIKKNLSLVKLPLDDNLSKVIRRNRYSRKAFIQTFSKYGLRSFLEKEEFQKWENAFLKD